MMQTEKANATLQISIAVLGLTLLLAGPVPAEPSDAPAAAPPGAAGLSFLIVQQLGISSFDGALLSYRTRAADGHGWRFGVSLSGTLGLDETSFAYGDTALEPRTDSRRRASVGLTVLRVREPGRGRSLGCYWAMGPTARYGFERAAHDLGSGERVVRTNAWNAGLAGVMGVEWRASEALSLLAEYGAALTYNWSQAREWTADSVSARSTRSISLGERGAKLGLTAWF